MRRGGPGSAHPGRTITVEHLLTHTSGIPSYTGLPEWLPQWRKDMPLAELIGLFKDKALEFEPGTRWKYDNSGYVLLGAIVERVSGESYDAFVQKRIFEPLGMKDSSYGSTSRIVARRVPGYSRAGTGYENAAYLSMTQAYAAGALLSTVDDLLRWDQALTAGRAVPAASLQRAWTPYALADGKPTGYGYGWAIADFQGDRLITHGVGINGFVSSTFRVPDARLFVAVLSNDAGSDPGGLAVRLVAIALGKPIAGPKAIAVPEAALEPLVGVYGIDAESRRFITRDGARLFSQRSGGERHEVFARSETEFFFKDGDDRLRFVKNATGRVTGVQLRGLVDYGPPEVAERTDEPLPSARRAISVDPAVLDRHRGEYEVAPGMTMTITREGGSLFAQMTGEEKLPVFPESETLFFLEKVDAQIEFVRDAEGRTTGLVILQGGQNMPAARLK